MNPVTAAVFFAMLAVSSAGIAPAPVFLAAAPAVYPGPIVAAASAVHPNPLSYVASAVISPARDPISPLNTIYGAPVFQSGVSTLIAPALLKVH